MARKEFDPLEIVESIANESAEDVQRTALAILQAVVTATPVGDPTLWQNPNPPPGYVGGHARRNWIVSLGSFADEQRGTPGRADGGGAATAEALGKGRREIDQFTTAQRRLIIQNNVPYITRLNNGHSTQAPRNFVQTAVQVGRNVGRNDRKELP